MFKRCVSGERQRSKLAVRFLPCSAVGIAIVAMIWFQGCIPMKTDVGVSPHSAFNVSVEAGEKIAILFSSDASPEISNDFGEQMVHCVHDAASKAALPLALLQQQEVYEALFPDLSPKQVLIRSDTLPLLVSEPEIRDRIDRLKLRYLVLIGGETEEHSAGGGVPYIVVGAGWDKKVDMRAQVFELEHGTEVGAVGSQAKSGGFAGLIFIIPMGWASFDAEGAACEAIGAEFLRIIVGSTNAN